MMLMVMMMLYWKHQSLQKTFLRPASTLSSASQLQ